MATQEPAKNNYSSSDVYARLVAKIAEIEKSAPRPETSYVNISSSFYVELQSKPKTYAELLKIIDEIESRRGVKDSPKEKETPVTPVAVSARQQPSAAVPQPQQTVASISPVGYVGLDEAMKAPEESVEEKKRGFWKPKSKARIDTSNLVLPSLQLAEQVTELEHIIQGLKQAAFDKEHFQIVVDEVYGLKQVVDDQKIARKNAGGGAVGQNQQLMGLRDKKIAEAMVLLQKGGK